MFGYPDEKLTLGFDILYEQAGISLTTCSRLRRTKNVKQGRSQRKYDRARVVHGKINALPRYFGGCRCLDDATAQKILQFFYPHLFFLKLIKWVRRRAQISPRTYLSTRLNLKGKHDRLHYFREQAIQI